MLRTQRLQIRDPQSRAILASRWSLANADTQMAAARACLAEMPEASGLVRYSIFRGVDDAALFHLAQWQNGAARDHFMQVLSAQPNAAVDAKVARILRDWREAAAPYRASSIDPAPQAGCLVVVRQPLAKPDADVARDWIDSVISALEAPGGAPEGLCAASFFISEAGGVVLNLAEWTSAQAHRAALATNQVGEGGESGEGSGGGLSREWRAVRAHPGITAAHEVKRYELFAALEPET
jgi:hypothetical protein